MIKGIIAVAILLFSTVPFAYAADKISLPYTYSPVIASSPVTLKHIDIPQSTVSDIKNICTQIKSNKQSSYSKGQIIFLSGFSGTSKIQAAEMIAGDMGRKLYKVDLSRIVGKYIGETEKNLDRIFAEAEQSDIILFFDEADSLFGKRTETKDADDRYANLDTNYLLERIEAYKGVIILSSNLGSNTDPEFLRRIPYIVEYSKLPLPLKLKNSSKAIY